MCGVQEIGKKGTCTNNLCGVARLDSGAPFEVINDREVWHPVWNGRIDDGINTQFIKAAAECIWKNEKVSRYVLHRMLRLSTRPVTATSTMH